MSILRSGLRYLRRHHLALLALFAALGGTSYAALSLPPNSVGTKQIRNGGVRRADIGRGAVTGAKVKPGSLGGGALAPDSLGGDQIKESALGTVPNASNASHAGDAQSAGHAGSAVALDGATYKSTTAENPSGETSEATLDCPSGTTGVGPSIQVDDPNSQFVVDQYAGPPDHWTVHVFNNDVDDHQFKFGVVCASLGPVHQG
jgi:hypothetical protein